MRRASASRLSPPSCFYDLEREIEMRAEEICPLVRTARERRLHQRAMVGNEVTAALRIEVEHDCSIALSEIVETICQIQEHAVPACRQQRVVKRAMRHFPF